MARAPRESLIDSAQARSKLKSRSEPYWRAIVPGTFLGFRKGARGHAWVVRQRQGDGYAEQRIGTPDDHAKADGDVVLSYSQAVKRAQQVQLERRTPQPRHYGDGLTLNTIVDEYLVARQAHAGGRSGRPMSAGSAAIVRASWRRYAGQGIGQKRVAEIDAKALRTWHAGIASMPPAIRGKVMPLDLSDPEQLRSRRATANRVLTTAKAALTWASNEDRLPDTMPDYWRRVQPFNLGEDPVPRMLDQDEISRLINACAPDLRKLVTAALLSGARYGELTALRVRDYDSESGTVRLQQTKTGKTLVQALTPEGVRFFEGETAGRAGDEALLRRTDGRAWDKSSQHRPMRDAAAAAKIEDISFKVTRATYGKLLLLATRDIELVAKALGHSDSRITRRHYAQLLPSEVARGIAKMPALGVERNSKVSRLAGKKPQAGGIGSRRRE